MLTKEEVIEYCSTLPNVYKDYPFDDNWVAMRCKYNNKTFAFVYKKDEYIWINVKVSPEWIDFFRNAYEAVVPAYHMNKSHWNSIILNGSIPELEIIRMINESYDLVKPKSKKERL